MNDSLFDRVVAATQVAPLLAPFVVQRVAASCGFIAREMTPADLKKAMPKLLEAISVYVDPPRLARAREELRRLASS